MGLSGGNSALTWVFFPSIVVEPPGGFSIFDAATPPMKPSLEPLSFLDTIARVELSDVQLRAMVGECVQIWQTSSSTADRERATHLLERLRLEETFETALKNVTVEAIAVSGLLVTLDAGEDLHASINTLPAYAHDAELSAVKREIASRGVQINRRLSKVTGLKWTLIQERLALYLNH